MTDEITKLLEHARIMDERSLLRAQVERLQAERDRYQNALVFVQCAATTLAQAVDYANEAINPKPKETEPT